MQGWCHPKDVHEIHSPNQDALLNDEWHGISKELEFHDKSMRPIHEHIEQENSNQWHVFLRNLINVRSSNRPGIQARLRIPTTIATNQSANPAEGKQVRSQYLYRDGVSDLLSFVPRKEFLKGTTRTKSNKTTKIPSTEMYNATAINVKVINEESWRTDEP